MKENLIILLLLLVFLLSSYLYYEQVIVPQPQELKSLEVQIEEKNRQLLAAQILAEKREGVTQLIRGNLIENPKDSLAEKASVPFLRYLTSTLDWMGIRLVAITPLDVLGETDETGREHREYIQVPYEIKVLASYEELGKLLDVLEKSPHLIRIANLAISNDMEQSSYAEEIMGKPKQHPISLQVNTIAILKASYRSEPG